MPRGQDTGSHPGRKVGRDAFSMVAGGGMGPADNTPRERQAPELHEDLIGGAGRLLPIVKPGETPYAGPVDPKVAGYHDAWAMSQQGPFKTVSEVRDAESKGFGARLPQLQNVAAANGGPAYREGGAAAGYLAGKQAFSKDKQAVDRFEKDK